MLIRTKISMLSSLMENNKIGGLTVPSPPFTNQWTISLLIRTVNIASVVGLGLRDEKLLDLNMRHCEDEMNKIPPPPWNLEC